jgi:hypothetical protein
MVGVLFISNKCEFCMEIVKIIDNMTEMNFEINAIDIKKMSKRPTSATAIVTDSSWTEPSGREISSSSDNSNQYAWYAFNKDNRVSTIEYQQCWLGDNQAGDIVNDEWFKIKYPSGLIVTYYAILYRGDMLYINGWVLQGSNDDVAWIDLDAQTGITTTAFPLSSWFEQTFSNDKSYQYYRLYIPKENNLGQVSVKELKLFSQQP